jgi:hypothetical protein
VRVATQQSMTTTTNGYAVLTENSVGIGTIEIGSLGQLDYAINRRYSPVVGRFMEADPPWGKLRYDMIV